MYSTADLPTTAELGSDLRELLKLYDDALAVRDTLRIIAPDKIFTTKKRDQMPTGEPEFKPKSSEDDIQQFKERTLVKERRHEKVVEMCGNLLSDRGLKPNTNVHPRDMTVDVDDEHWLFEVKVVYTATA